MASLQHGDGKRFLIRGLQSSDIPIIARMAATEYFDSVLNSFLCPYRHKYPEHVTRRFTQMIQGRYLNPRNIGFVAVDALNPSTGPVGYAQFIRLGNDQAAKQLVEKQSSLWLVVRTWWFKIYTFVVNLLSPDRSVDHDALSAFMKSVKRDELQYWDSEEMKAKYENRWHTQSIVVSSSCQRQGLGRRLMEEVLQRAQNEGVVVGLEASEDGEKLYQSLGFTSRGPFSMTFPNAKPMVGGIMMWTPR